ncbi:hypothetical protein B0H10DRAFT_2187757 [Mycena sp. CBHHK59/15]|nr:hypothetical protein B0H10DRAFT_2187757 [Mycena sp. CBHHK59/15]
MLFIGVVDDDAQQQRDWSIQTQSGCVSEWQDWTGKESGMLELLEGKKEQKKGGQPTNRSASKIHGPEERWKQASGIDSREYCNQSRPRTRSAGREDWIERSVWTEKTPSEWGRVRIPEATERTAGEPESKSHSRDKEDFSLSRSKVVDRGMLRKVAVEVMGGRKALPRLATSHRQQKPFQRTLLFPLPLGNVYTPSLKLMDTHSGGSSMIVLIPQSKSNSGVFFGKRSNHPWCIFLLLTNNATRREALEFNEESCAQIRLERVARVEFEKVEKPVYSQGFKGLNTLGISKAFSKEFLNFALPPHLTMSANTLPQGGPAEQSTTLHILQVFKWIGQNGPFFITKARSGAANL